MKKEVKNQRLQSLDALRGFDMFFIMGGGALFVGLATWCPTPFFQAIANQMEHVPWHGFAFEDMIFPLFLSLFFGETKSKWNDFFGYLPKSNSSWLGVGIAWMYLQWIVGF